MMPRIRWSRSIVIAVAALAGTIAAPITAGADEVKWSYRGKDFRLQIPAGFCEPTGQMIAFAEELRFLDKGNDTHLVLTNCDATDVAERWIILKSPKNIRGSQVPSRAELLREAKRMNLPALETFVDKTGKEAGSDFGRELEQMVGETTSVRPALKPLAIDDIANCATKDQRQAATQNVVATVSNLPQPRSDIY